MSLSKERAVPTRGDRACRLHWEGPSNFSRLIRWANDVSKRGQRSDCAASRTAAQKSPVPLDSLTFPLEAVVRIDLLIPEQYRESENQPANILSKSMSTFFITLCPCLSNTEVYPWAVLSHYTVHSAFIHHTNTVYDAGHFQLSFSPWTVISPPYFHSLPQVLLLLQRI